MVTEPFRFAMQYRKMQATNGWNQLQKITARIWLCKARSKLREPRGGKVKDNSKIGSITFP